MKDTKHLKQKTESLERARAVMPDENLLSDLADLYKVFGDTTRVRILYSLFENEMCVCAIADLLKMTQSAISHQLSILRRNKLVSARRDGKTVYYSLADTHITTILECGMEHLNEETRA
ncbi:MAG: helix-turn-helix transcriptional regulator [Clostridia bacterium]|nr:helix-turn-helix transcriptional regulator [Clostridia bacterium]